jgi:hypothetical protein
MSQSRPRSRHPVVNRTAHAYRNGAVILTFDWRRRHRNRAPHSLDLLQNRWFGDDWCIPKPVHFCLGPVGVELLLNCLNLFLQRSFLLLVFDFVLGRITLLRNGNFLLLDDFT